MKAILCDQCKLRISNATQCIGLFYGYPPGWTGPAYGAHDFCSLGCLTAWLGQATSDGTIT